MRSSAAATETSLEPCPSARSNERPRAQRSKRRRARQEAEALGTQALAPVAPQPVCSTPSRRHRPRRLGEVASGDRDVVSARAQDVDHRSHDQDVGAVGQVDPDAHGHPRTSHRTKVARRRERYPSRPVYVLASVTDSLVNIAWHFVRDAGLPAIFVLMLAESACIPIPSEATMLFAGFAVADPGQSAAHHHLTLIGVVAAGVLGNLVGSWLAYKIGWDAPGAWSWSSAMEPSCTSSPRIWPGPTAGSSATARRPSSSAGCCR